ncbi:MAG TPA: acyltransferase [Sphingomonas sp.]|nr:acyltransferase [Sphingomonas sp.]
MAGRDSRNLIALDLLRFACALLVLSFHYCSSFASGGPPGGSAMLAGMPVDGRFADWASNGWIGVELFFLVSGFVIAWSAEGSTAAGFLRRRALRLVPAAWLCATLTAVVLLGCSNLPPVQILFEWLSSLGFSPFKPYIDPSYWTLAIEVAFYLAMAAVLVGGSGLARIERFGVLLGCASLAFWMAAAAGMVPGSDSRFYQLMLLSYGCFFALGIQLRVIQRDGARPVRLLFALLFAVVGLIEIDVHRALIFGDRPAPIPAQLLFGIGLLPILFAERLQPWLARRISGPFAATLGLMTYPLYLLHQELGAVAAGALMRLGTGFWPAIAFALAMSLGLSWLTVRFGEPWVRAGLMRLGRRPAQRSPWPSAR